MEALFFLECSQVPSNNTIRPEKGGSTGFVFIFTLHEVSNAPLKCIDTKAMHVFTCHLKVESTPCFAIFDLHEISGVKTEGGNFEGWNGLQEELEVTEKYLRAHAHPQDKLVVKQDW